LARCGRRYRDYLHRYAYDALEAYIDARTMEIHHTKHHRTYVDKLNAAIGDDAELQGYSAEERLKILDKVPEKIRTAVRNPGVAMPTTHFSG
jgi:Fe-Mn family superoxide dismutase